MRISEIRVRNFRNFTNTTILFNNSDTVILGENGTGKTNLFRLIRMILDNRYEFRLKQDDYPSHLKHRKLHWIIIQMKFSEVKCEELGQFGLMLNPNDKNEAWINLFCRPIYDVREKIKQISDKIKRGEKDLIELESYIDELDFRVDYEVIKTIGEVPDYTKDNEYLDLVGDIDSLDFPDVDEEDDKRKVGIIGAVNKIVRQINIIFIPAGRNPYDEMTGTAGIIRSIFSRQVSKIPKEKLRELRNGLDEISVTIESIDQFRDTAEQVNKKYKEALGEINAKKANVSSLISDELNDVIKYLGLNIEDGAKKHPLSYRSLGEHSIFHLALRMVDGETKDKHKFTVLLVEEPEVHLHTHLQRTLFINLQNKENLQLLLSTHSNNISQTSSISKMIILDSCMNNTLVFYPSKNLTDDEIRKTERYLDANRTPLLFARRVLLVEGDAEAIILPWLFKKHYEHSLDEYTVSLVKVDSTFFIPISQLFDKERINRKCYIITDRDMDYTKSKANAKADKNGRDRMEKLLKQKTINDCIVPSFALNTFEIQLYKANLDILKDMLNSKVIYKDDGKIKNIETDLISRDNEKVYSAIMKCVNYAKKGWLAIEFIDFCEKKSLNPKLPIYIKKIFDLVVDYETN